MVKVGYDEPYFERLFVKRDPNLQKPERRLMLAVLEEALHTYSKYSFSNKKSERRQYEDARKYLLGETKDSEDWPFSAENICNELGINFGYLKRGMSILDEREVNVRLKRVRYNGKKYIAMTKTRRNSSKNLSYAS